MGIVETFCSATILDPYQSSGVSTTDILGASYRCLAWWLLCIGKRTPSTVENKGVVYLSHIPHGFYDDQIKGYFAQFGKVTNVSVPRSKTGRARGFAFVEFQHPEVAEIAAETMNNYLMFKRLIKGE
ncbi:hypothetical protein J6590_079798 [Homalodisca vitripennis]|nr:hypothetical protein J6590_079798 [Homalodisca vitripennis]